MVFTATCVVKSVADLSVVQNPAFGAPQVRELTEIFVKKSIQVAYLLAHSCDN
jgi:hypothetical protein